MTDEPLDLDKHRGMAAQKATDIRRVLADVESNARDLRDRQAALESQLLSVPAGSWPEAAAWSTSRSGVTTRSTSMPSGHNASPTPPPRETSAGASPRPMSSG